MSNPCMLVFGHPNGIIERGMFRIAYSENTIGEWASYDQVARLDAPNGKSYMAILPGATELRQQYGLRPSDETIIEITGG